MREFMKNIKVLIGFLVLGLLMTPTFAFAQNGEIKTGGNTLKFDKAKYEAAVKKSFNGNVMGYQVVLLKNGQVISMLADGKARNAADGETPMTINTPANIGSSAKFFTGTALLQFFERPANPYYNPKNLSVDGWLDEKIYLYFPKVWQDNMHASIKKISFRDLLEHRGGFIQNDKNAKVNWDYLKIGVSSDQSQDYAYGKRKYANAHMLLAGYLLPLMAQPRLLENLNKEIAAKNLKPEDPYIEDFMGNQFEIYIKKMLFGKTLPAAIKPSCDAPNEYPQLNITYAKIYKSVLDEAKGAESASKEFNGACHGTGGWYLTGKELGIYAANFATNKIVSDNMRMKMFSDNDADNRLVWSFTIDNTFLKEKLQWNTTPYMGGDWGGAHATIMQLPNDYYIAAIVNSGISPANREGEFGGSNRLSSNLIDAFKAGIADNF
jgi:hypothetical protein